MKKNILKKFVFLPLFALAFGACDEADFLTRHNPNEATDGTFWLDGTNVEDAVATMYSPMRGQMYGYYGAFDGFLNLVCRGDDVYTVPGEEPAQWQIATFLNSPDSGGDVWSYLYKGVQRTNAFLEGIAKCPPEGASGLSDARRALLIGEAKFMRGYYNFLLVTNYGSCPLRVTPVKSVEDANAVSSSEEAIWEQIIKDLNDAASVLPVVRDERELGRANKGAAIAYLGKSYATLGKYSEAKVELDKLLNAPFTYDLMENYEDNFLPTHKMNKESIFEIWYDPQFGGGGTWGSEEAGVTQGMVLPQFITPEADGGWFKLSPSAAAAREFIKELRPAGSDTKFDKRMYTTFFFKYSDFKDTKADETWFTMDFEKLWKGAVNGKLGREPEKSYENFPSLDGVKLRLLFKKYTNFWMDHAGTASNYTAANRDNDFRIYRFAEVLLLHAEACAQTGDIAGANADLKRIRQRAGLSEKTWNDKESLMNEIMHQNFLEFCMEGQRFFNLKRWYTPEQMKQVLVNNGKQGAENFGAKHYIYPIPRSEMDTNGVIEQNPLWK